MSEPQQPYGDPAQSPGSANPYEQPQYGQSQYGQPQYGQPQYGQQMSPSGQGYGAAPIEHPQGTIILVLGILGFFVGITGVIAWVMGSKALKEIRSSSRPYSNEQTVVIGRILGIITTVLWLLGILATIVLVVIGIAAGLGANY